MNTQGLWRVFSGGRMAGLLALLVFLFAGPVPAAARGVRETPQEVPDMGDVTITNGEVLHEGAEIRARGRIGIYGNVPFTFPALRTEISGTLLENGQGPAVVPLLLELSGLDPAEIERWQDGPVIVTGEIVRMPEGPAPGLLEVSSLREP